MIGALTSWLEAVLVVLPLAGLVASGFLWRVYRADPGRPRSWLLFHMALTATIATALSFVVSFIALSELLEIDIGQLSGLMQVTAALVLEVLPIGYGLAVWLVRRGIDPPFTSSDDRQ